MADAGEANYQRVASTASPHSNGSPALPHPAPRYLSLASAEIILSEVRPTKIKPEALLSVNLFVDELLWLILNSARSLATERLNRDGIMRILPTGLGKEALLEAEVELKAYWDRTDPVDRGGSIEHNVQLSEFPLQAAFQLMRAKCEVYSTLGDAEEDIEEEDRLQNQMMLASSGPPKASAVAPAALYITAMLEHICEHVLSNVAQVVARDSSRTTAHLQDLYVALCEDDNIYPLFKRMKVKDQLEAQNKAASRPRRAKSVTTNTSGRGSPSARGSTSSPQPRPSESQSVNTKAGRTSNDSTGPSAQPRTSGEKSRLKMFGGRSPPPLESVLGGGHGRSESSLSDTTKRTAAGTSDHDAETFDSRSDFEDLMRSGATMKVSLTPDRLKTFEVFAKEKGQRSGRSNSLSSTTSPISAGEHKIPMPPVPVAATTPGPSNQQRLGHKTSRTTLVARSATVDAIEEDEDEEDSPPMPSTFPKPRSRTQSLAQFLMETPPWENGDAPIVPAAAPSDTPRTSIGRARSQTASSATPPPAAAISLPNSAGPVRKMSAAHLGSASGSSTPPSAFSPAKLANAKVMRKPAKNIEDIDLDDLMGDDDVDSLSPPPTVKKTPTGSKDSLHGRSGGVSSSTREMIDFLSEGPPGETAPAVPPAAPANVRPAAQTKAKPQGRLGRMFSRLARSNSTEQMARKANTHDEMTTSRSTPVNGNIKTSQQNNLPQWTRPTPPPPPPSANASIIAPAATPRAAPGPRSRSNSAAQKPVAFLPASAPATPSQAPMPIPAPIVSHIKAKTVDSGSEDGHQSKMSSRELPPAAPTTKPAPSPSPLPRSSASRPSTGESDDTGASVAVSSSTKHSAVVQTATAVVVSPKAIAVSIPSPAPVPSRRVSVAVSTSPSDTAEKAVETSPSSSDIEEGTVQAPPSPPTNAVTISTEQALRMRKMINQATSAEECRVLVEMFLAQWGLPRTEDEVDDTPGTPLELGPQEEAHQPSLVENLLSDSLHLGEQSEDAQTDDAHDLDPRTPNSPADAVLHPDAVSSAADDDDLYRDETYIKKMQQTMLPSHSAVVTL